LCAYSAHLGSFNLFVLFEEKVLILKIFLLEGENLILGRQSFLFLRVQFSFEFSTFQKSSLKMKGEQSIKREMPPSHLRVKLEL